MYIKLINKKNKLSYICVTKELSQASLLWKLKLSSNSQFYVWAFLWFLLIIRASSLTMPLHQVPASIWHRQCWLKFRTALGCTQKVTQPKAMVNMAKLAEAFTRGGVFYSMAHSADPLWDHTVLPKVVWPVTSRVLVNV